MNREDLEQKLYELSVCAGMNQRYHQAETQRWGWWDRGCKIATGIFAVFGAALTAVSIAMPSPNWWVNLASILVATIAAGFSVALNVVPLADWAMHHSDLFRRWTDLREETDGLDVGSCRVSDGDFGQRIEQLDAKVHRICGAEPLAKKDLLQKCYSEEEQSRQYLKCAVR